jgi:antitoxin component YwqK of YwqJK toxin-antitoxin module
MKKHKLKPYLKYHRIFVLTIIFTFIVIKYITTQSDNKYENGQIKQDGRCENGFNVGRWIWYYPNGVKQLEGYFDAGKRKGKWLTSNKYDVVVNERNYENDRLNGYYCNYYDNGVKKEEGYFFNDVVNGSVKKYDSSGKLTSEENYKLGQKIK